MGPCPCILQFFFIRLNLCPRNVVVLDVVLHEPLIDVFVTSIGGQLKIEGAVMKRVPAVLLLLLLFLTKHGWRVPRVDLAPPLVLLEACRSS